jgi:predicted DNA binding CopG/RHH family protein
MTMSKLDKEEKEILEAYEQGGLRRSRGSRKAIEEHRAVAEATFKKDARINIRLPSKDLRSLQARALREGIPYQTLVASVLHKYVDGQLVEKNS